MTELHSEEGPNELRLDLPAAHSAVRMARQMLRQFALREGVPEEEVERLEFVTGELLDNAVDHGGGNAARDESDLESEVRMTIALGLHDDNWTVEVGDQGGGEPEPMRSFLETQKEVPDLEDERGRGFFLIMNMVDEIGVEKSEDGLGLLFRASRRYGDAG